MTENRGIAIQNSSLDKVASFYSVHFVFTGIRMLEGANINRSLLALANCINALGKNTPGKVDFPLS